MNKFIILILLCSPIFSRAENLSAHDQSVQDLANIGAANMTEIALYGLSERALRLKPWQAIVFSTAATTMVTAFWRAGDPKSNDGQILHDLLMFHVGISFGVGEISLLRF